MKVLLAGASGALGIPIARQLLADGHQVLGLTRDPAGARRLEAMGVTPVVADALDRGRLLRAVDGDWADTVIHELTALRKPPARHRGPWKTRPRPLRRGRAARSGARPGGRGAPP